VPGTHKCLCPEGSVPDPDPYTKCTEVIKCSEDDECPGNAFCDLSARQCLCPEPNVGGDCRRKEKNIISDYYYQAATNYLVSPIIGPIPK